MDRVRDGVLGLLERDDEVLLIRKPGRPEDEWIFPGGGVEDGETAREAFLREMREELGLDPDDFDAVEVSDATHRYPLPDDSDLPHDGQAKRIVTAQVREDAAVEPNRDEPGDPEVAAVRWVAREAVPGELGFADLRAAVREFL